MILCVSGIRHQTAPRDAFCEQSAARPYLELTDGWYRIIVEIDDCLTKAVDRGKIVIGRKLAVSGAKVLFLSCNRVLTDEQLVSGSDGAEVLEALDKSRLIISGNSSALARWHTKLGLQPRPFIAGLSKLSPDGGTIVLMDIFIDKIYPLAFMPADKGDREPPWNEAEEQMREDKWTVSL